MKRIIETLNEMSFILPEGWEVTADKYKLINGQGFINRENYLSKNGKVISLFEIHRDPDEFFQSYQGLVEKYNKVTEMYELGKQFTFKFGDFEFPAYIINGCRDKLIYILQVFINCMDRLACFMITLDKFSDDTKQMIQDNETLGALVKILRTIE